MPRRRREEPAAAEPLLQATLSASPAAEVDEESVDGDEGPQEKPQILCRLTGESRDASDQERALQNIIEQFHQEFDIPLGDMARDVRITVQEDSPLGGRPLRRQRAVSLVVYQHGRRPSEAHITRVAVVAPPTTKGNDKAIDGLKAILGSLSEDLDRVYGVWTNGSDMAFWMRDGYDGGGIPTYVPLTDIPGPDEALEDLETADRRPLRLGTGASLLRTFKHCHDSIYGNQAMRPDRAFWQLLYLIFCKIHDEQQSRRQFFVGATEANDDPGRSRIAARIKGLFDQVRGGAYGDVFDGREVIELNDRVLAYVAGQLSRYDLRASDTDAKGLAYEAITSTTLKRDQGQFFTPRNVIRMMIDMLDPGPGKMLLDPACGSGGFLVMALSHMRRQLLAELGVSPEHRDHPLPSELKRIEGKLKRYAGAALFGVDVDPELKKVARMNMVMNNDGHGNIQQFNSLEYGVPGRRSAAMDLFDKAGGGHERFDFVVTNPPFGAKIPITDAEVLRCYDLGHQWTHNGTAWVKGALQRKVAPEVLFIESCYKFLKPGEGVMALVVPNGILGNPGQQMEFVRFWLLHHMELLASVDLPGEAFLPQVSVQASCVFLRRRTESEKGKRGGKAAAQRPVFMAIADRCGHGRRGEERFVRRPDGRELLVTRTVSERREKGKDIRVTAREELTKVVDDDMPWIAAQYRAFVTGGRFEEQR